MYLGLRQDPYELVEDGFIMGMFSSNPKVAREKYMKLVYMCNDEKVIEDVEFTNEETEYRSERWILIRNIKADEIIKFIIEKMGVSKTKLHSKNSKGLVEAKAILVFMMRSLCNFKCCTICKVLGNITQARVSTLSSLGIRLIDEERYRGIVEEFMNCYSA